MARSFLMQRREFLLSAFAVSISGCGGSTKDAIGVSDHGQPVSTPPPKRLIGIDLHNHVYPTGTEPHPQHGGGPPGGGPPGGGSPPEKDEPSLALGEALKASGLTAVCSSFVLDFAKNDKPGDARTNFLAWLDAIDAELAKAGLKRALTWKDVEDAYDQKKPTIIQTVEGAHFIEGDLARISEVHQRGLRHLQLLHDKDDLVAPLGDLVTGVAHLGGLTPMGAKVIEECARLGIVVDLAHANAETIAGAVKVAKQPIIVSHTNLATWTGKNARLAEMMKPRLISVDTARTVAATGGVVGVWTKLTESAAEYVQSLKMMVDAIGSDHVGIGTDNDLLSPSAGKGTNFPWRDAGALEAGFFPTVVAEMRKQGWNEGDIAKVSGANYGRVFAKVAG